MIRREEIEFLNQTLIKNSFGIPKRLEKRNHWIFLLNNLQTLEKNPQWKIAIDILKMNLMISNEIQKISTNAVYKVEKKK